MKKKEQILTDKKCCKKAFSLMELMIVMLIVAIAAAVTAPLVTKKMARSAISTENPVQFVDGNNAVLNANLVVGALRNPDNNNRLHVQGNGNINGNLNINSQMTSRTAVIAGLAQMGGAQINGPATIDGTTNINGTASITGNTTIGGAANIAGAATIGGETRINNDATVTGNLNANQILPSNNNNSLTIGHDNSTTTLKGITKINGNLQLTDGQITDGTHNIISSSNNVVTIGDDDTLVRVRGRLLIGDASSTFPTSPDPRLMVNGQSYFTLNGSSVGEWGNLGLAVRPSSAGSWAFFTYDAENNSDTLKLLNTGGDTQSVSGQFFSNSANTSSRGQRGGEGQRTSDRRLKNIGEKYTAGLDELKKLDFFHYTFKKDKTKRAHVGVIAQDLQSVFPDSVTKGDDGYLRIRWDEMFYAVINAVKQLDEKIAKITEDIKSIFDRTAQLEATVAEQQKVIEDLKAQNEIYEKQFEVIEKRIKKLEKKKSE